jgi:phospholipid-binding lipoprotein MlaA
LLPRNPSGKRLAPAGFSVFQRLSPTFTQNENDRWRMTSKRMISSFAMLNLLLLVGCANAQHDPVAQINDPYEAANRKSLAVNQAVFGTIARGYDAVTPPPIRQGLSNVSANLREPRIFANEILQLRFGASAKTAGRFVVNSTFGIGGVFDVATSGNLPKQSGDFGQTLFVWGVGDGPYLFSPFLGASTARDTVGFVVDAAGSPVGWTLGGAFGDPALFGLAGLGFVTQVDQFKQDKEGSIDFYTFLRSSYYRSRRAQLCEAIGAESPADAVPLSQAPTPQHQRPTAPSTSAACHR